MVYLGHSGMYRECRELNGHHPSALSMHVHNQVSRRTRGLISGGEKITPPHIVPSKIEAEPPGLVISGATTNSGRDGI